MIFELAEDFRRAVEQAPPEHPKWLGLDRLRHAIDLSMHVLGDDSLQLNSQLWGRLVGDPTLAVRQVLGRMERSASRPWLRLVAATMASPGGAAVRTLLGHPTAPAAVLECRDERRLLSTSSGRAVLWDLQTGEVVNSGPMGQCPAAALFADGRRFATAWGYWLPRDNLGNPMGIYGDESCAIVIRELPTFKVVQVFAGHNRAITAMAVTSEGDRLVSSATETKVWDTASGAELFRFGGSAGLAVTETGGRRLALVGEARRVGVWDIDTGRRAHVLATGGGRLQSMAVSPAGDRAALVCAKGVLAVWDARTGRRLGSVKTRLAAKGVVWADDGERVAVYGSDGRVQVWDVSRWAPGRRLRRGAGRICAFRERCGEVNDVALTGDGRYALVAFGGRFFDMYQEPTAGGVSVWDLTCGRRVRALRQHTDGVTCVKLLGDGRRAVSASWDRSMIVWDLAAQPNRPEQPHHAGSVNAVAISSDSRIAVTGSQDHTLRTWDLSTGRPRAVLKGHKQPITALRLLTDKRAVSASLDGAVRLWNATSGRRLRTWRALSKGVLRVELFDGERKAVSTYVDGSLRIWDLTAAGRLWPPRWRALRPARILRGHTAPVTAVAVFAGDRRVLSGSSDGSIRVWDVASGSQMGAVTEGVLGPREFAILPDLRRVVVALHGIPVGTMTDDETLQLWDIEAARQLHTLAGHQGETSFVRLLPDGRRAVSASVDGTLKVWDADEGRELHTLRGHSGPISGIALFPDGRRVASACYGRLLKIWDLDRGRCIATFAADGALTACAVAGDGRTVVAAEQSGTVHILQVEGLDALEGQV